MSSHDFADATIFRFRFRKMRNDSYINTTKILPVRVPCLLSSNPCLSAARGLAILLGVTDRLSLSIMAEKADIGVERTRAQPLLRSPGDCEKLLEKRRCSFLSLGAVLHLISHLSRLLHELANALTVLERAALFESRAVTSQAFALGDKDGVRFSNAGHLNIVSFKVTLLRSFRCIEQNIQTINYKLRN